MKQKINENAVLEDAVETTTDVNDEVFKQTNVVEETENEPEVKKAEVFGVESQPEEPSKPKQLSNEVVNNCNDYAKAGDILPVTITKIHLNDEPNKIPYVKVTARSGVFNSNLAKIKAGNVYKGKVSHRNKLKQLYSVVLNNGVVVTIPEKSVIGGLELDRNDNVIVHIKFVKGAYITGTAYKAR